ncbi:MAG: metallophosphoesterase [Clostridia bacterium]|nr:metallophosphoesterase [Clostridia bacterium]
MPHDMIRRIHITDNRRIICISDIHGHLKYLDELLKKVHFADDDLLIIIGDVIESGEASLGALRRVMELTEAGNCIALCGNWEHFMHILFMSDSPEDMKGLLTRALELDDYYGSSLLADMCRELGIEFSAGLDMAAIMPKIRTYFAKELDFMANMPLMLDCGEFACVHGGVPSLDEAEILKLAPYELLKNDAFAEQGRRFDRWLITGHWPVANYDREIARFSPHIYAESKIAAIDGGCGKQEAAQLNALIMRMGRPGEFEWESVDGFPRIAALEAQAASENPLHTVWGTRFIDVIVKNGGWAKVYHHATGRVLEVPEQRLWMQNGKEVLGDYTDYALPVEKGDILSVVFETDRGLCCKKDGASGWYYGRYEKI